ncbi:MAG: hypothetical protein JJU00_11275 [Opitutales bacterium]|nr:hypothetical protein [Opitutales bacterium]
MSLPPDQRMRVDRLLLAREERLARIHAIEREIESLLGQPYPFDPPPADLPSLARRKRRKKRPARKAKKTAAAKALAPVRPLRPDESAYRITYTGGGGTLRTEIHHDAEALAVFLAALAPADLRVETLDAKGNAVETLHPPPALTGPENGTTVLPS